MVGVPPELEDVVRGGDELPFAVHGGHAATGEASDAAVVFGLTEHGLDRRASLLVEPSTAWVASFAAIATAGVGGSERLRANKS